MILIHVVLTVLATGALLVGGYLALLAVLARRRTRTPQGRVGPRFDVVVPAHDEEAGIDQTLRSLLALDYPEHLRRILVVADNCTDRTADLARAHDVVVLERHDPERRGKGYALDHAYAGVLSDGFADAVVVIDADTLVSPSLLQAFAARFEAGAEAVQAEYGVRNPDESWRTRLAALGFALMHRVRSLARERLGLSAGLRGNGMGFSTRCLTLCPHEAHSVVEDIEYGLQLGLEGVRVHYVPEAQVFGEMAGDERGARTQHERWEQGRVHLLKRYGGPLVGRGLREGSRVMLDLVADLLVPPLSTVVLAIGAGALVSAAVSLAVGAPTVHLWLWLAAAAAVLVYVARGVQLSGLGWKGVRSLAWAPVYVGWKVAMMRGRGRPATENWTRTPRQGEAS